MIWLTRASQNGSNSFVGSLNKRFFFLSLYPLRGSRNYYAQNTETIMLFGAKWISEGKEGLLSANSFAIKSCFRYCAMFASKLIAEVTYVLRLGNCISSLAVLFFITFIRMHATPTFILRTHCSLYLIPISRIKGASPARKGTKY